MSDAANQIVFFVDRSLGKNYVVNALRCEGELVERHDDWFAPSALDTVWLPDVARKGWVILTADQKIAYRNLEFLAVEQSGARLFTLVSGNLSGKDMAAAFVKGLPSIKKFILDNPSPFIAKVYKDGTVKDWK